MLLVPERPPLVRQMLPSAPRATTVPVYRGTGHRSPSELPEGGNAMESLAVWETPEFEEIAVAPEVTMYVAQMDD
jgi:coenzyme PQQ precursor peptide PqqA